MIVGVGTDIVEIARIEATLERLGESFAARILTPNELLDFNASKTPNHFVAKRFAAKEAMGKALGTGIGQGVSWQHMEVLHSELGAPYFQLSHKAMERFKALGGATHHLSLSDEKDFAVAFVILES